MRRANSRKPLKRSKPIVVRGKGDRMNYAAYLNRHSAQVWIVFIIYAYLSVLISIFAFSIAGMIGSVLYSSLLIVAGAGYLWQIINAKRKH